MSLAPESEAATGHDDRRPEGAFELIAAGRPGQRVSPSLRSRRRAGDRHPSHRRARQVAAASLRRLGIRISRRRATMQISASPRHHRPVPGRRSHLAEPMVHSRSSSALKAAGTRFRMQVRSPGPSRLGHWTPRRARNDPQVGMMNMRGIMPSLQKAKPAQIPNEGSPS